MSRKIYVFNVVEGQCGENYGWGKKYKYDTAVDIGHQIEDPREEYLTINRS